MRVLGIDASVVSTGLAYWDGSSITTDSKGLKVEENTKGIGEDYLLRKALKEYLREFLWDKEPDVVVIEDVFGGVNPAGVRKIYAINSAVDGMIDSGEIRAKLVRVQSRVWKKWILDGTGVSKKGYNDKVKVALALSSLGVFEEGKGRQDRLDAAGMVWGYLIKDKISPESKESKVERVPFSKIELKYHADYDSLLYGMDVDPDIIEFLDAPPRVTKKWLEETVAKDINLVYVTKGVVNIGSMLKEREEIGLFFGGGYLAFYKKGII